MKKLMIAAAIVCAAAATQAASILWGSTGETFLVDKSSGETMTTDGGYDYVLVYLGESVDYSKAVVRGDIGEFVYEDGVNLIQGNYDLVSGTDVSTHYYAVMAQDQKDDTLYNLVYKTGANAGQKIETYQLTWNGQDYDTPEGFTVGANGNFYVDAAAVPEPFSGSLALLGMGVLALRRKMKKAKKA